MSIETPPVNAPPVKKNTSCLKVGGITCLTMLILALALTYFLYMKISKTTVFKDAFSSASLMTKCMPHLAEISGALNRYNQKKGAYPDKLIDLYPTFLEDKANLHCPADPSPADNVSYTYKKPDKKTLSTDVVVSCDRHKLLNSTALLVILKNGKIVQYTVPPGKDQQPIKGVELDPNNIKK